MFDRLSAFLSPLWALCLAGAVVIFGLALGFVTWVTFAVAALIGLLGVPLAIWNARKIRDDDPNWRRERPAGGDLI